VDVRSITQPTYSLTVKEPADVLLQGVMEAVDAFERLSIALRLRRGRVQKARGGGYAGGGAPFGYTAERGGKVLEVNPTEAATVRRIFSLRRGGYTAYAIAARLNEEGIPTREGKAWTPRQVSRILGRAPFYRGKVYRYGGVEATAQHPAILGPAAATATGDGHRAAPPMFPSECPRRRPL